VTQADADQELQAVFRDSVEEGERRLGRTWSSLFATGLVGGLDVSVGVFALLLIQAETGSHLLASLGFTIGFIALTLANSELFTENFLMPITAVVAGSGRWPLVGRLWAGTAVMNLVGGLVMMFLITTGMPEVGETAGDIGRHFTELGINGRSFALAMVAGIIITLMTWMQQRVPIGAQTLAAIVAGFLLAFGELNHCIVASLEMFAAMLSGAQISVLDWLAVFSWAALGNMVGGIALVTVLRLVQVGRFN
jgi:formate-nitrite transporter family protein